MTLAAGALVMLPGDYEELARSSIAQQLMLSNVFFWHDTGYFATAADLKPLLHTWSLAVEEQFYLGYPFLLVFLARFRTGTVGAVLVVLAIISFGFSEWFVHRSPSATFFLLPTRAWEMLLGGIVCFAPAPELNRWRANLLSATGLAAILGASLFFDSTTRFPGSAALLPCAGTALLIYASSQGLTWVGKLLAAKPVVFIGLLSYSLYLWHWPILAFSRYWLGDVLSVQVRLLALIASLGLAFVSWRLVETPFRTATTASFRWKPYLAASLSAASVLTVSGILVYQQGLKSRWPEAALRYTEVDLPNGFAKHSTEPTTIGASDLPTDSLDFIVWGDSHGAAIARLCDEFARTHGLRGAIGTPHGRVPLLDVWKPSKDLGMVEWNRSVIDYIKSKRIRHAILVARWELYVETASGRIVPTSDALTTNVSVETAKQTLHFGLLNTIRKLRESGVAVWIMKQVPHQNAEPNSRLARAVWFDQDLPSGVSLAGHLSTQANVNEVFERLSAEEFQLLDPTLFCFTETGESRIGDSFGSYYRDHDHLSDYGCMELLHDLLEPVFVQMANDRSRQSTLSLSGKEVRVPRAANASVGL